MICIVLTKIIQIFGLLLKPELRILRLIGDAYWGSRLK